MMAADIGQKVVDVAPNVRIRRLDTSNYLQYIQKQ
jgi:hypothetical protein